MNDNIIKNSNKEIYSNESESAQKLSETEIMELKAKGKF